MLCERGHTKPEYIIAEISIENTSRLPYNATQNLRDSSTFLDLCILDDEDKVINFRQRAVPFLSAHDSST